MATRTGVHSSHQHERSRIVNCLLGACHCDMPILQGLPHYLQHRTLIFRKFIKEEDAIMRQWDFSGMRVGTTSYKSCICNRVVRRTERTLHDKCATGSFLFVGKTYNRMNLRSLQGFFQSQRRKDSWYTFGNHRFTGTGRANHDHVMSTCSGNLDSSAHLKLSAYIWEIDICRESQLIKEFLRIYLRRNPRIVRVQLIFRLSI